MGPSLPSVAGLRPGPAPPGAQPEVPSRQYLQQVLRDINNASLTSTPDLTRDYRSLEAALEPLAAPEVGPGSWAGAESVGGGARDGAAGGAASGRRAVLV